jgi:hypothetical protein
MCEQKLKRSMLSLPEDSLTGVLLDQPPSEFLYEALERRKAVSIWRHIDGWLGTSAATPPP